ncbi:MAG: hypothetical protein CMC79_03245 [Flavobacteriaceae bacterium]|nr:hypothetical protein [Flavobacteriaceae bacterium]|tara:strand:+ start:4677 stop:5621 length:945 start_codon:yes stop_codon:yes gene_type:complete
MTLAKCTKELLYKHECVTVPGFGAFLTRSFNFEINYNTGRFVPSRKEIIFNSLLKSNDGILANYLAEKQNISYKNALRKIEKEVLVWKQKLNTQPLYIGSLGKMWINEAKKLEFEPYGKINFDSSSFGLSTFNRPPLKIQNKAKNLSIQSDKENLIFTPSTKTPKLKRRKKLRYTIAAIFVLCFLYTSIYFGEKYIQNQKIINQELAQKKILSNVQASTFYLGKLNSISINVSTNSPKKHFSVIAGSFRNKKYAKRKLENLKKLGYNRAAILDINLNNMYRVAYGRFASKEEAIKLLYYIKYSLKEDAWYLSEN